VVGVAKAYTTRAGSGPFVPELSGALAARFQEMGGEIVAATAFPRRVGMFDVPVVRYAARVNGFDALALTKLDVLSGLDEVPVCMGYLLDGEIRDEPPFDGLSRAQPLTEMLPGWKESLRDCRSIGDLPAAARRYVETISAAVGLPVCLIGVGSASEETIVVEDPFGVLPA
jgi:adenylosuccinate synthase